MRTEHHRTPRGSRNGTSLASGSHRERDDDYTRVIAQLNSRWRVIVCKDGIQWIVQKRDGTRDGRPRWTGVSYHLERKALIRRCSELCGIRDRAEFEKLGDLPAYFRRADWAD